MILLIFAAAGAVYQFVATAIDKHDYPPPGKLVDVGGYRLHVNCSGADKSDRPRDADAVATFESSNALV